MPEYVCVVDDPDTGACGALPDLCWHGIEALAEARDAERLDADPWLAPDDAFPWDADDGGEAGAA